MIDPHRALITAPIALLGHLVASLDALLRPGAHRPRLCVVCDRPVTGRDAFLRQGGSYVHAEPCLERGLLQRDLASDPSSSPRR